MAESMGSHSAPGTKEGLHGPLSPDPWWHSLLYSTGYMLLVPGIPAVLLLGAFCSLGGSMPGAMAWMALMVGMILVSATGMLAAAHYATRCRRKRDTAQIGSRGC